MPTLSDRLACPRCGTAIDELSCNACGIAFPVHDDVPWLVADPDATRFEWRNRWQMAMADLERRQQTVRRALDGNPPDASRARLEALASGYAEQHRSLKVLLGDLGLARPAALETYQALRTRLPTRMGLMAYEANVFRDWVWGAAENATALNAVSRTLGDEQPAAVLVLGAGAGRLPYDLHQTLQSGITVALELNPLLTTVTRHMARGDTLTLTEFPLAPRSGTQSALRRTLRPPGPARPGFEVVLADATRPPFRPGSFDVVVTPWLLDVLETPPAVMLALINGLLGDGGLWIYHGSVAFDSADVRENPDLAELQALAAEAGFETQAVREETVPYMDCPDSRHGRRESVVTLAGRKTFAVPTPPPQQSLPDWLATGREPVPLLTAFQNQATATRIHAFIMSLIDGRRSLGDMAAVLEAQRLMPKDEAATAIRGFLIKMLDEAAGGGRL